MSRLIAVVQLEHPHFSEPVLSVDRVSGGVEIPAFMPRRPRPGRPWGRSEVGPRELRVPDAEVTLEQMGLALDGEWDRGANGMWVADVSWPLSLQECAAVADEPVTVALNVSRLLAGEFVPPEPPEMLVGAPARLEAATQLAARFASFAGLWVDQARSALQRLGADVDLALNVIARPWEAGAVSFSNTQPDDGRLAWYVWREATRRTPGVEIPVASAFLR